MVHGVTGTRPPTVVPLFTPSLYQLRAGAVWVTISNWADSLAHRYGGAEVITPTESMSGATVRAAAWPPGPAGTPAATGRRQSVVQGWARTLAKDIRWAIWSRDGAVKAKRADLGRFRNAPFVWQHHDLFARAGFEAAERLHLPVVLFVDAPQVWEARQWGVTRPGWGRTLQEIAERPQFERADVVACVSDEVAAQVLAITHERARVLVTPCTAAVPAASRRGENRSRLNLDGRLVVGWVGSFRRFHHVDMLVRASASLSQALPELTLLLIGDGPTRAECARLADELNVDCRMVGNVPNGDVIGLLQACDVGVLPSGNEGTFHYSPLKLKEYLAARLPTIVPQVGEMARTLQDGIDTLFYPPGDVAGMATQLLRMGREPGLREAIAGQGHRRLKENFSLDEQLARIEETLSLG